MRTRLDRPEGFDYQVVRSNEQWVDHQARTLVTAALIAWQKPESILDPACGDGSIVLASMKHHNPNRVVLTDISIPTISAVVDRGLPGNVEAKVIDIDAMMATDQRFDMVVLTETLEHVPDPEAILRRAREKANILVASSPEMRPNQIDTNPEHLWMFDGIGYNEMLVDCQWSPIHKTHLAFPTLLYDFGVWVCR